jgi:hypothetical protein
MTAPTAADVLRLLEQARAAAEDAYQASTPATHERVVLSGLVADLDESIAQLRDLMGDAS